MFFDGCGIMWGNGINSPLLFHPYNINNNTDFIGVNCDSLEDAKRKIYNLETNEVVEHEKAFVRKVIDTVNDLDNVMFEIINEATSI